MRIETLTQRSTSQSKSFHFAFIDSLRGLAVLWVFFYHAQGEVFGWNEARFNGLFRQIDGFWDLILIPLRAGTLGVAIFFAVSGFCIHLSHQRLASKSWKVFFSRRFFRLYPAYLVILFVFVFASPLYHFSWHSGVKLRELILHVLSLHNLDVNTKFAKIGRAHV